MFNFSPFKNQRARQLEWLDDPLVPPGALIKSLRAVGRINRATGGIRTSMAGIKTLFESRQTGLPIRVLDVGTGDGSFLAAIARWSDRHEIDLRAVGIELRRPVVAHISKKFRDRPDIDIRCADLFELTSSDRFDLVHASLVLHHFEDEMMVRALGKMRKLADTGVVVNDLHRHVIAHAGSHVLVRALTGDRLSHHDGPLSVLRGFTRAELADACRRAGLHNASVAWRWPFRWLVTAPTE